MSEYKWNVDAIDAIRIIGSTGEFEIVGADTNEILVEGEGRSRGYGTEPGIAGRWLEMYPSSGHSEWTVTLPKSKAWVVELMCGTGEVSVQDLHARLNLKMGSGEIHIENCRGVFSVSSGNGDVELENCAQAEVPEAPPHVAEGPRPDWHGMPPAPGAPPVPPMPGMPPIPPIPPIGIKIKTGKGVRFENRDDWEDFGEQWGEWGERFAEQASQWAENFSRNFAVGFDLNDREPKGDGVSIRLGHGDIQLQEIDALLVTVRVGSGDLEIEHGRIAELEAQNGKGDIQIEGVLPTAAWELVTRHGDIQLVLPGDAYARLDAATRHGDITCDAPLVRVGRPGPGSWHGGRMVGTVGEGTGDPADIHLESQHGDINIDVERRPSRYAGQPAPQRSNVTANREAATPMPVGQDSASNADVPVTASGQGESEASQNSPKPERAPVYDSQMAILQALQAGEITVTEAELLLKSVS